MVKRGDVGVNAMDALKAALADRQAKAQKLVSESGRKWVKRGDYEERRKEEYMEDLRRTEEAKQAEEEAKLQKMNRHLRRNEVDEPVPKKALDIFDESLLEDDDATPPLELEEVIDRLRGMNAPITLFGETDMQRFKRLRKLEKEALEGKVNPDVLLLEQNKLDEERRTNRAAEKMAAVMDMELPKVDEEDVDDEERDDGKSDSEEAPASNLAVSKAQAGDGIVPDAPQEEAVPEPPAEREVETEVMDKCDFIRAWLRKSLKAWEKQLAETPADDKVKSAYKVEMAQHRQCRRDIRPLQKRLRVYVMERWLLEKIHSIVKFADDREYRRGSELYLDLTIGRAAWPLGIGCGGSMLMEDAIGLHDRFNRMDNVKDISFGTQIDDTVRKYTQAIKRLMNVAQRYWPPDNPSMMI